MGEQHFIHGRTDWPQALAENYTECRFRGSGYTDLLYQQKFSLWRVRQMAERVCLDLGDETGTQLTLERHANKPVWSGVLREHSKNTETQVRMMPLDHRYTALSESLHVCTKEKGGRCLAVYSSAPGIGDQVAAMYAATGLADIGYQVVFYTRCAE